MLTMIVVAVILALAFDFTNGFHDTANAIATSVSTRALSPRKAVLLAGVAKRFLQVQWSVAGRIVIAWIITIPISALLAALIVRLFLL